MTTLYRIRYRDARDNLEEETVVEANSPNEAMVKFRCACDAPGESAGPGPVISVQAETYTEQDRW